MAETSMSSPCKLVLIGGSAGSLDVIMNILPQLTPDLTLSIIIVLHRKSSNDSALIDLLSSKTSLLVKEAEEKEPLHASTIYIAPGDYHLLIEKDCSLSLDYSEKINYSRPSIDVTFETAAEALGTAITAILLSGANQDGVRGLAAVQSHGGMIVAQDPLTADVPYMPQQAIEQLRVDRILAPAGIIDLINAL